MATVNGTPGDDNLASTGDPNGDVFNGNGGNDLIQGGAGNDTVNGNDGGNDIFVRSLADNGSDTVNLGGGDSYEQGGASVQDVVVIAGPAATNVRLTFTSAEVGNGTATDAGTLAGQDGGLAVRLQAEDASGALIGSISRYDDEGVSFVNGQLTEVGGARITFDVRDLVSGAARGEQFEVVSLLTGNNDVFTTLFENAAYYVNGGAGGDTITGGNANDFLVGGAGDDTLSGGAGQDNFLGGAGNDTIDSLDRPSNIFAGAIPPERDVVDAGAGDDTVTGGRLDSLAGGDGFDTLLLNFDFNGPLTSNPPPARPAVNLTLDRNGVGTANDGTAISGFESLNFTLTDNADTVNTGNVRAVLNGGGGNDVLTTGSGTVAGFSFGGEPPLIGDEIYGGAGVDTIRSGAGNDTISGGAGIDIINAGAGDDLILFDPTNDGIDRVETGLGGNDVVRFEGFTTGQIRLTFVSAEVGNGNMIGVANGDGNLAVRVQREGANDALIGGVSRYDDEGVTFIEGTQGYTFDVRDLVSGAQRGDQFVGVVLGTSGADNLSFFPPFRAAQPYYYNGGQGDDVITAGEGNDFLVGGAGNDRAIGSGGNDNFIGGGGVDILNGGAGVDTVVAFNPLTDGADQVNLGFGDDVVNVTAPAGTNIRLSFVSGEVGNGSSLASDRGQAVRLQAETNGTPGGDISRFDDEGITFVGGNGVTFDVRDFVSGAQRGEAFEIVRLGDSSGEMIVGDQGRPSYINGGGGSDIILGGAGDDFLVGGAGNDTLTGAAGADRYIGGGGQDTFRFTELTDSAPGARDTVLQFVSADDTLDLSALRTSAADTITLGSEGGFTTVSVDRGGDGSVEFILNVEGTVTTSDYVF